MTRRKLFSALAALPWIGRCLGKDAAGSRPMPPLPLRHEWPDKILLFRAVRVEKGWHEFLVFDNGTVEGFGDEPLMLMYSFDNESYREIARLRIENEKLRGDIECLRDTATRAGYCPLCAYTGPRPKLKHDLIGPAIDRAAKHYHSAVTVAG